MKIILKNIKLKIFFVFLSLITFPFLVKAVFSLDATINVLPGPPLNAQAIQISSTEVELTWDASLSPASSIASYSIYYKLKTAPTYPLTPQIVRTDSLMNYSEIISVSPNTAYDFRIIANTVTGLNSGNCGSCEASNAVCGNGVIDFGEACDGLDLNGLSCNDFSNSSGTLNCSPSCNFDTSSCIAPRRGGGGQRDTTGPNPGVVSSPATWKGRTIPVTYSGVFDFDGSGLSYVTLYYKKDKGTWLDSGLNASTSSGSFEFIPEGDGVYYFDLRAFDRQGNSSSRPISGDGDTKTLYDTTAPVFDQFFFESFSRNNDPIFRYTGFKDMGPSGIKKIELWFKQGVSGQWTNTGVFSSKSEDSLLPNLKFEPGIYYFSFVLEDLLGNRTEAPQGSGYVSVVFPDSNSRVLLANLPDALTKLNETNIRVYGQDVVAYKYQLNEGSFSDEISVDKTINLANLLPGSYTLKVIGKNKDGLWQSSQNATTYTWRIASPTPQIHITGPFLTSSPEGSIEVNYTIEYKDFKQITLKRDDILLTKRGDISALIDLSKQAENRWLVKLKNIVGEGGIGIGLRSGTAVDFSGKLASGKNSELYFVSRPEEQAEILKDILSPNAPEIIPPFVNPPSFQELQQVAISSIRKNSLKVSARQFTVSLPKDPADALKKVQFCQKAYPYANLVQEKDDDSDGISNRTECYLLTSPFLWDTDRDGCGDGEEFNFLMTNPLNSNDCPLVNQSKIVRLTSPTKNSSIAELQLMGITPSETSRVDFMLFPVLENKAILTEGINIGTVFGFREASIKGHYFFEYSPNKLFVLSGKVYDVVAVSTLEDSRMISSPPVRFKVNTDQVANPPVPTAIENAKIDPSLKLTNVQVWTEGNGRIRVSGRSEYGAKVQVMWKSIVLASSIINDSNSGLFSIQSPLPLEIDQAHEITLFAIKQEEGQEMRSRNVNVSFFLHGLNQYYLLGMVVMMRLSALFIIYRLKKHYK